MAFGPGWTIEAQPAVALDEESEPEPDIAVLAGGPRNYLAPTRSRRPLSLKLPSAASSWTGRRKAAQLGQRRSRAASPAPDGIGDLRPVLVVS
jgi:hypothetical protein